MESFIRYYRIADITIQVESDVPFQEDTFSDAIELFRVDGPGEDMACIHHHFQFPDLINLDRSNEIYHKAPWAIYRQADGWLYLGILPEGNEEELWSVSIFNQDHSYGHIYHNDDKIFSLKGLTALTTFPTDQILIARLLAERQGCYLHSAAAVLNGAGMLFAGHSEAGKSTTTQMLIDAGATHAGCVSPFNVEILCDDRNIIRRCRDGWRVYGSWSHGDIPLVSPASAPLRAICFLEQSTVNALSPITEREDVIRRLLSVVIKPLLTQDWWDNTLTLIAKAAKELPCYEMRFDKSGKIIEMIENLNPDEL